MADTPTLDRRAFLQRAASIGLATLAAPSVLTVVACKRKQNSEGVEIGDIASCDGTAILTNEEQAQRRDLNYVEKSDNEKQTCETCIRFIAPDNQAQCGACGVIGGPINPKGYCDDWEPKDLKNL